MTAYLEGFKAGEEGKSTHYCPYSPYTTEKYDWLRGHALAIGVYW